MPAEDPYREERERLVEGLARREDVDDRTLEAMRAVPRHDFVPKENRDQAYADRPLPIGKGQTISAPHMVAIMTGLLALRPGHDVLEIGTGCGYHAGVTAEIVGPGHVYSVEYYEPLADAAGERLDRLGYDVHIRCGDGHEGWPEGAPFDRGYLTCATPEVPQAVIDQVRPGGRILAPVGTRRQRLIAIEKRADGSLEREDHGGVRFVTMQ